MPNFFEGLEEIDDTPDLEGARNVVHNQEHYKIQIIDALLALVTATPSDLMDIPRKGILEIGTVATEPRPEKVQMENHVKEDFLNELENQKFIKRLEVSVQRIKWEDDCPDYQDLYVAHFSFLPSSLKAQLEKIRKDMQPKLSSTRRRTSLKSRKHTKFPHRVTRGTTWDSVIIKFLTPERVSIIFGGKTHEADFREMGFEDQRSGRPNNQWVLLQSLAEKGGSISWDDSDAKGRYKKTVQKLDKGLREYLPIAPECFFPYREGKTYTVRMTLIPPEPEIESEAPKEGTSYFDEYMEENS